MEVVNHVVKQGKPAGVTFISFLSTLEGYTPTISDSVTNAVMCSSGFNSNDPRFLRLVSVAAQRFLTCIVNDALQHYKVRASNLTSKTHNHHGHNQNISFSSNPMEKSNVTLTIEDLAPALSERGVSVKKPSYYE